MILFSLYSLSSVNQNAAYVRTQDILWHSDIEGPVCLSADRFQTSSPIIADGSFKCVQMCGH